MWKKLFDTDNDYAALVLRVVLAIVMFPHGAQKVLGWFGGYGPAATYNGMTQNMHIPGLFVILDFAAEFLAPIGLLVGLLGRVAAFGIGCMMIVAIGMVHGANGFFMNWANVPNKGEGFEYHLLALAIVVALIIRGSGALSLDGLVARKMKSAQ